MARNPAVRKAEKAAKRKAVVAAKRKAEAFSNSPAGRLREAAGLPILDCLVSEELFETGVGYIILARGASREHQSIGFFMLDTLCLGVKDVFFRTVDRQEAEYMLDGMQDVSPLVAIPPEEARKLLRDVAAWASGNGFPQPEGFVTAEPLFGTVKPTETDYTARCGRDGRVLYIPGPAETPAQIRRRTEMVRARFGDAAVDEGVLDFGMPLLSEE